MDQRIQEATSKGFTFVQDCSTNTVHASSKDNQATCNKRFNVFKIAPERVTEFWCPKCIKQIDKKAN